MLFRAQALVAEDAGRPPWCHTNIISKLVGDICGQYDAQAKCFVPGGLSVHNMMLSKGPDTNAFDHASKANQSPDTLGDTMSFTVWARVQHNLRAVATMEVPLQYHYIDVLPENEKNFDGTAGKE